MPFVALILHAIQHKYHLPSQGFTHTLLNVALTVVALVLAYPLGYAELRGLGWILELSVMLFMKLKSLLKKQH